MYRFSNTVRLKKLNIWSLQVINTTVQQFAITYSTWSYKEILDTSSNFIFIRQKFSFSHENKEILKYDWKKAVLYSSVISGKNIIQFNLLGEDYFSIRIVECIVKLYMRSFYYGIFTSFPECTDFTLFFRY